jgi:hypothetical protein
MSELLSLDASPVGAVAVSSHNSAPSPSLRLLCCIFYLLAMPAFVPHGRPWRAHIEHHATPRMRPAAQRPP